MLKYSNDLWPQAMSLHFGDKVACAIWWLMFCKSRHWDMVSRTVSCCLNLHIIALYKALINLAKTVNRHCIS